MTSLFRYGNRLLLRNCCCPPPPPPPPCSGPCEDSSDCKPGCECVDGTCVGEEGADQCFCGSWCSYFAEWDGNPIPLISGTKKVGGPETSCGGALSFEDFSFNNPGSYGPLCEVLFNKVTLGFRGYESPPDSIIGFATLLVELFGTADCIPGKTCDPDVPTIFLSSCEGRGPCGCQGRYGIQLSVVFFCEYVPSENADRPIIRFEAFFSEFYTTALNFNLAFASSFIYPPYRFGGFASGIVDTECKSPRTCTPVGPGVLHVHIADTDLEISVNAETGITINNTVFSWGPPPGNQLPNVNDGTELVDWTTDTFPYDGSLTIKRENFCSTAPCDCDVDISGRTVTFKGKNFTVGTSSFTSDGDESWTYNFVTPFSGTRSGMHEFVYQDNTGGRTEKSATVRFYCSLLEQWVLDFESVCFIYNEGGSQIGTCTNRWTYEFLCDGEGSPISINISDEDVEQVDGYPQCAGEGSCTTPGRPAFSLSS